MAGARKKLRGGRPGRKARAAPDRGAPAAGAPEPRPPPAAVRESVEDPLEDWPDDDDRWLLDRDAEDVERDSR